MSPRSNSDNNKHSVWSYRIIDPVRILGDRNEFFSWGGVYHVFGYTTTPQPHLIGVIEFVDPVPELHVERVLGVQFRGSLLVQPLTGVMHCARSMAHIKDVNRTGGTWMEQQRQEDDGSVPEYPSDRGEDYTEYSDEENFDHPEYQPANPDPPHHPNEETFDAVDAIAELGERLFAHI